MSALFSLGSNGSGQLGIGHKEDVSVPKQVLFNINLDSPIHAVAAGGNHTLLLTESRKIYWSGNPSSGACGLTSQAHTLEPLFQEIRLSQDGAVPSTASKLAATWDASFIVQPDQHDRLTKLYTFGSGDKGELGRGPLLLKTPSATLLPDFPPSGAEIVDVAACMAHVVVVLDNGDAYGWGNGRKGQLGEPADIVHQPRKIDGMGFPVARAVCGREFTCLLAAPGDGRIRVLGSDKWDVRSGAPESVRGWTDVAAGWGSVYVLRDGGIRAWGRDDHGQLPPPGLPPVAAVAAGSEHVVALSAVGDVLAWGWGEHGNCGPKVDSGDVRGRWNVIASQKFIPKDAKITGVGAGCATSWIIIKMA